MSLTPGDNQLNARTVAAGDAGLAMVGPEQLAARPGTVTPRSSF